MHSTKARSGHDFVFSLKPWIRKFVIHLFVWTKPRVPHLCGRTLRWDDGSIASWFGPRIRRTSGRNRTGLSSRFVRGDRLIFREQIREIWLMWVDDSKKTSPVSSFLVEVLTRLWLTILLLHIMFVNVFFLDFVVNIVWNPVLIIHHLYVLLNPVVHRVPIPPTGSLTFLVPHRVKSSHGCASRPSV